MFRNLHFGGTWAASLHSPGRGAPSQPGARRRPHGAARRERRRGVPRVRDGRAVQEQLRPSSPRSWRRRRARG
eukprot:5081252-Prymnesium_polylepis.1